MKLYLSLEVNGVTLSKKTFFMYVNYVNYVLVMNRWSHKCRPKAFGRVWAYVFCIFRYHMARFEFHCSHVARHLDLASISSTFFKQLLRVQIPKAPKNPVKL